MSGTPRELLSLNLIVTSKRDPGINSNLSLLIFILIKRLLVSALIRLDTPSTFPE